MHRQGSRVPTESAGQRPVLHTDTGETFLLGPFARTLPGAVPAMHIGKGIGRLRAIALALGLVQQGLPGRDHQPQQDRTRQRLQARQAGAQPLAAREPPPAPNPQTAPGIPTPGQSSAASWYPRPPSRPERPTATKNAARLRTPTVASRRTPSQAARTRDRKPTTEPRQNAERGPFANRHRNHVCNWYAKKSTGAGSSSPATGMMQTGGDQHGQPQSRLAQTRAPCQFSNTAPPPTPTGWRCICSTRQPEQEPQRPQNRQRCSVAASRKSRSPT